METIVDYVLCLREGEPHCGGLREHWDEGLRAAGLVPEGAADQVQVLRDKVAEIVEDRSAAYAECLALRERADKALVRAETAERSCEALLAKCTPSRALVAWLERVASRPSPSATVDELVAFVGSLNEATRKTREEIVVAVLREDPLRDHSATARHILAALDASEAP